MRLPVNHALPLAALLLLQGCIGGDGERPAHQPVPANGPAADYPMVIGEPFTVGDVTYRPEDRLNYDAVGYAALGAEGGETISIAHKTLPLPSYVEVTALDTGKTILARVERRGPMTNERLVELSPGAVAQLGLVASDRVPVRVRRVNPPEPERSMLRSGQRAPTRMDTPKSLAAVLMRKLEGSAPAPQPLPSATPSSAPEKPKPVTRTRRPAPAPVVATPTAQPTVAPAVAARPVEPAATGTWFVQAAAFSSRERADATAAALGGRVDAVRNLHRVRMGPFQTQAEAAAALAKARRAGYTDARILRDR